MSLIIPVHKVDSPQACLPKPLTEKIVIRVVFHSVTVGEVLYESIIMSN